jgi:hypothetical protein
MWTVLGRLLAVLGLAVSLAGFVAFAGAAVAVWKVKAEANRRTDALAAKAHEAVGAADHAVDFVRQVLGSARKQLEAARGRSDEPPQPVNPFLQLTARQASQSLAGSVERADAAVVLASDAAVVAEAALALLGDESEAPALKQWLGIKPDQLARTQTDLQTATRELRQVRTLLGVSLGDGPTDAQLVTVEAALDRAGGLTDQMGTVVATARVRLDETKRQVDLWVLRVALGVTLVGAVGAAGQAFMARYCWRVLRRKPA